MKEDKTSAINKALAKRDHVRAKALIQKELRSQPRDLWLLRALHTIYFEIRADKDALKVAKRQYSIAPSNTLVIWDYATALDNVGRYDDAITMYKRVLQMPLHAVASSDDIRTVRRAQGIRNDCRYRIGECYANCEQWAPGIKWLRQYLHHHRRGLPSIYRQIEVRKSLKELIDHQSTENNISLIEKALDEDDLKKARPIILAELRKAPDDVWLIRNLSSTYYEQRKYKKALEISTKAYEIAPGDSFVLWDHAGSLDMTGRKSEAIQLYKRILRKKVAALAEEMGNSRDAYGLSNDCRYRIGLCYADLRKYSIGSKWLRKHLDNRKPGIPSIYPSREVRRKLKHTENRENPRATSTRSTPTG